MGERDPVNRGKLHAIPPLDLGACIGHELDAKTMSSMAELDRAELAEGSPPPCARAR